MDKRPKRRKLLKEGVKMLGFMIGLFVGAFIGVLRYVPVQCSGKS